MYVLVCTDRVGARNINTIKEREKCISSILEVDTGTVRNVYCSYTLGPRNPTLVVDVERCTTALCSRKT